MRDSPAKSTVDITTGPPYHKKIEGDELDERYDEKKIEKNRTLGRGNTVAKPTSNFKGGIILIILRETLKAYAVSQKKSRK